MAAFSKFEKFQASRKFGTARDIETDAQELLGPQAESDRDMDETAAESAIEADEHDPDGAHVEDVDTLQAFVFAGNATFTLVSKKTGARYTYRIARAKGEGEQRPWFVSVLVGPDNGRNYRYVGTVWPDRKVYVHGKKARIGRDAPSVKGVAWFLDRLADGASIDKIEFWHEGTCGRCGRRLTVPSSIATGMGPVCATKGAM